MQKSAVVHDTVSSAPPAVVCRVHLVPFHCSVPPPEAAELVPTASQKSADTQDTAASFIRRPLLLAWAGLTVGCRVHVVPFHCSARAIVSWPAESFRSPTASQKLADTQDTAVRLSAPGTWDATPVCNCQPVPFQPAASVTVFCGVVW